MKAIDYVRTLKYFWDYLSWEELRSMMWSNHIDEDFSVLIKVLQKEFV
jgi:hypothetical protein